MSIEGACLKTGEPIEDFDRPLSDQRQIDERLRDPDVGSIVCTNLHSQEGAELLVLFYKGIFKVSTKGMVSLIETFQDHLEFAFELPGDPGAEHVGDLVCR